MEKKLNVLIPAVGMAKYLAQRIREEARKTGGTLTLTDLDAKVPTQSLGDFFYATPRVKEPAFEEKILEIAKAHAINAILPKRQQEFLWWSSFVKRHPKFTLMISGEKTLNIANDKRQTYTWLKKNHLPVTSFVLKSEKSFEAAQKTLCALPWFAKPVDGSGTRGVAKVTNAEEYEKLDGEMIVQPMLKGTEYTISFYVDRTGKCRVVIPHRRDEVRDGEVSTGVTVNEPYLIELGQQIAEKLPGAYGPLCFQVIHDTGRGPLSAESVAVTDLNARFGGGYPLTEAAGGNYAQWLVLEAQGQPLPKNAGQWQPGTRMVRTDKINISNGSEELVSA